MATNQTIWQWQPTAAGSALSARQSKIAAAVSAQEVRNAIRNLVVSGGVTRYTHQQTTEATVWTVPHNLGRHPSVVVTDSSGGVINADVSFTDNNIVRVEHGRPLAGFVYCS